MNALTMVAHPDDCVIFAYSFMHNHPEYNWTVCYLTYTESDARAQEFIKFWTSRNVAVQCLGFVDDYRDLETQCISFDQSLARNCIQNLITKYDLVLTHDQHGEYGHLHHVFVNQATVAHPNRVTFARPGTGTVKYSVDAGAYSLEELPLHKHIISGFHQHTHINEYNL